MREPRVWVGPFTHSDVWYWCNDRWTRPKVLARGDIFVPGDQGKPTIDPADMKAIATCKEIDW